jgi:hypothetical protein
MKTSGCENKYRKMGRHFASMGEFVPRHFRRVKSFYQMYCHLEYEGESAPRHVLINVKCVTVSPEMAESHPIWRH